MVSARNDGNVDDAFGKGGKIVEAVYEAPHLAHATMEPLNATVQFQADKLDVWLGIADADGHDPASGGRLRPQARSDRCSQLLPRRRLRTTLDQRRDAPGDFRRQSSRQAGEAGVDPRRGHDATTATGRRRPCG